MSKPHTWRTANLLKPEHMPLFEEAAIQATVMPLKVWIHWLNITKAYKYALLCKFAKQVELCTPGHAFYPKMKQAGQRLLAADPGRVPTQQEEDDEVIWKQ
jgi:hypothetical protein